MSDSKPPGSYEDILYTKKEGVATATINRPQVYNAFRPQTIDELLHAFEDAWYDETIGAIVLTGAEGNFCTGGDQKIRGDQGYVDHRAEVPRLQVKHLQRMIREVPKPVIAAVDGWCVGGGHVLHLLCDLTIATDRAQFGQTGPRVGSFDAGFGAVLLSRIVGEKKAREIWFLCRQYDAKQALDMGLVNEVVALDALEETGVEWAREILKSSPTAIRCLKASLNADCDGQSGLQELAGNATRLFYMSEEGQEGRDAYLENRPPDFSRFPWLP